MANPYGYMGGMGPGPNQMGPGPHQHMGPGPHMGHGHQHMGPPLPPPPMPSGMDPSQNNAPLQFNTNKGKPPMAVSTNGGGNMSPPMNQRQRNSDSGSSDGGHGGNKQPPPPPPPPQNQGGEGMMNPHMGMMGQWPMMGPMMGQMGDPSMMGQMGDPSMMMGPMGYGPMGFMGPMGPMMDQRPKEIITTKNLTMYPPPPNAPPQSTRERPPGCRTVFIGGLPANMTEDFVREIFEDCAGPRGIISLRMSNKNFCHIRFDAEECVDKALFFSGYRVKIENSDDPANTGRMHVDFAQARDDLYEWECNQRALAREHRHRQRMEEERLRPPSPPPIIHYSDHEGSLLQEKLKGDDSFMTATQVLNTWLERGDCSRRNANTFYSMIQSVNAHVRRLMNEKATCDEEFEIVKQQFRTRLEGILRQFEQIEKVFQAAGKQKAWDHFSKAQRKNLELWKKQCQEIKSSQEQEFFQERQEAEMELSDNEESQPALGKAAEKDDSMISPAAKRQKLQEAAREHMQMNQLKDENDSLKCQLEAYKNEVDMLKSERGDDDDHKDKQFKALQMAFQGMQRQLLDSKKEIKQSEEQVKLLQIKLVQQAEAMKKANKSNQAKSKDDKDAVEAKDGAGSESGEAAAKESDTSSESVATVTSSGESLNDKDARLIALVSTFLHVHPFGASVDYIWSYLQQVGIKIRTSEIDDLLEKLPLVYRQDIMGVGASIEKRWKFTAFEGSA